MPWAPDYVTVDDQAAYDRVDDLDDEAERALAVTAASRAVDEDCNRQFGKVDVPVERFYDPWPDYDRGTWCLSIDDLMDTTGLVVTVGDTIVTAAGYVLEPRNAAADGRPWEVLRFTDAAEAQPCYGEPVSVVAPWGWTAFPVPVVAATQLQALRFLTRRDAPFGVAGSPDVGSEVRLLAKMDPDVAVMLNGYRRARRPR